MKQPKLTLAGLMKMAPKPITPAKAKAAKGSKHPAGNLGAFLHKKRG